MAVWKALWIPFNTGSFCERRHFKMAEVRTTVNLHFCLKLICPALEFHMWAKSKLHWIIFCVFCSWLPDRKQSWCGTKQNIEMKRSSLHSSWLLDIADPQAGYVGSFFISATGWWFCLLCTVHYNKNEQLYIIAKLWEDMVIYRNTSFWKVYKLTIFYFNNS